jgi:hypothetical protein
MPDDRMRQLVMERDEARANARILAHSYTRDCRPLARAVTESLAYPVMPEVTLRGKVSEYGRLIFQCNRFEHSVDFDGHTLPSGTDVLITFADGTFRTVLAVSPATVGVERHG